jgi:hypothetical protein
MTPAALELRATPQLHYLKTFVCWAVVYFGLITKGGSRNILGAFSTVQILHYIIWTKMSWTMYTACT